MIISFKIPLKTFLHVFSEHKWEFILLIAIILVIILAGILQLTNYRMLRRSHGLDENLTSRIPRLSKNKSGNGINNMVINFFNIKITLGC